MHDLIERQGVGARSHLGARLGQRHVTDVGRRIDVRGERLGDVGHAFHFVVGGVVDARRLGSHRQARVQLAEVAVVDERPVVLAVADDPHQAVQRVLQHVGHDAARAAVDDAGTHDHRAQRWTVGVEHQMLVRRAPRRDLGRRDRRGFVGAAGRGANRPDARRVDQGARRAGAGQRRQHRVEELAIGRRGARTAVGSRVHHDLRRGRRGRVALRRRQLTHQRRRATGIEPRRLLGVADERGDVMPVLDEGVEDGRTDVAGAACEEYVHAGRPSGEAAILLARSGIAPARDHRSQMRPPS
ncbi:MAG: hypothetical protein U0P30_02005 [Vicinamibacterales bacterium]